MNESDGVEEALEGVTRVAITAGARLGEQLSRIIEERARAAEASELRGARDDRARFDAERAAAQAELSQVYRPDWWRDTPPERVGQAFATARAWRGHDRQAEEAERHMTNEIRQRYGFDVASVDADPVRVREQLERYEAERAQREAAEQQRLEQQDRSEALSALTEAEMLDRAAEHARENALHDSGPEDPEVAAANAERLQAESNNARHESEQLYDSAERRQTTAAALESKGIAHETVATRMRADVSQGQPARAAVFVQKAAKARKGRAGAGSGKEAQLGR